MTDVKTTITELMTAFEQFQKTIGLRECSFRDHKAKHVFYYGSIKIEKYYTDEPVGYDEDNGPLQGRFVRK